MERPATASGKSARASIPAMPKLLRSILLALMLAASAALVGCGGDGGPDPSISSQEAAVLVSRIDEIRDNVDVGSCLVAQDRTEELLNEIDELPDSVDQEVKNALTRGATNLLDLLEDPDQCEPRTTTTEPTTTTAPTTTEEEQPTTTERTRPDTTTSETEPTTPTTTTQPTTPTTPGASGGIGPGGL
jgi:tRNA/tmRNA/rRNA uracil-C5-methylase (TrmA/RlmC/RlmD family)